MRRRGRGPLRRARRERVGWLMRYERRPELLISLRRFRKHLALFPCLFPQSARDVMRPRAATILVRSCRHRSGSSRHIDASELGEATSASCLKAAANQIRDPNRHAARGIERKVFESEGCMERPHIVIQRMRQHAEAADLAGQAHRRGERIEHQRSRNTLLLPPQVDCQLAEQNGGQRVGSIALLCLRQPGSLDLRRRQAHAADDTARFPIADHAGPRDLQFLVAPGMPAEPVIQRIAPAIEGRCIVSSRQGSRWREGGYRGNRA